MMKRKQIILSELKRLSEGLTKAGLLSGKISGYDAETIGGAVNIARNTVSKELTELCNEKKIVKIKSRPVQFLCRERIEEIMGAPIEDSVLVVKNVWELLSQYDKSVANAQEEGPFVSLIGYDKSLAEAVEKAKASVLYPPNGLNIMLSGNSGVGKTLFAEHIYKYALQCGVIDRDSTFVYFNCSEYYNNPELLTSQLFGHKAGAFTGATKDTDGLVKKAKGGYLFLDEVHRLSSESQEKLFSILDKGVYRKLGANKEEERVNLRLICATTEDLKSSFLTTFLRRIQVVIELPDLKDKSKEERLELIFRFFYEEGKKIDAGIRVSYEYLLYLLTNPFEANVGEIKSEIQFTCAQAYVKKISSKSDYILIDDRYIKQKTTGEHTGVRRLLNGLFRGDEKFLDIHPDNVDSLFLFREAEVVGNGESDIFYSYLSQEYKNLRNGNISIEDTTSLLMNQLEAFFRYSMNNEVNDKRSPRSHGYKIEEWIRKIIVSIEDISGYHLDNNDKEKLRMHFLEFISLLQSGSMPVLYHKNILKTRKETDEKAERICRSIEGVLGVDCPNAERAYITLLLNELEKKQSRKDNKRDYAVFLISHGSSTATSMADFANGMFGEEVVVPVDMPIFQPVHETLEILMQKLESLQYQKIILMVDMGSLIYFGDIISKKYQVETLLVKDINVSLLLKITKEIVFQRAEFNELICLLNEISAEFELFEGRSEEDHKLLIITCVSGVGTANTIRRFLEDILADYHTPNLRLLVAEHDEVESLEKLSKYVNKEERICGIIGTFRTNLPDVPFLYLEQLFSKEGMEILISMIELGETRDERNEIIENVTKKVAYTMSIESVTEYITLLNSKRVLEEIRDVFDSLMKVYPVKNRQKVEIPFLIHCSCMVERLVVTKEPLEMSAQADREADPEVTRLIKKAFETVEKTYDVVVTEGELYYIYLILLNE